MSPRVVVEEQQEARRSQLISATLKVVSDKGFSNVTLEDIAQAAGLSKGVALYYFESKEQLFLAAFDRFINALRQRLEAAIEDEAGPVEKVRAILKATLVGVKENRTFYRAYLDFLSLGTRHPDFQKLNASFYKGCVALDREIVREGVRLGVFRRDADAAVMRAIFDGLMLQWLFDNPATFDNYKSLCEDATLAYLMAPPGR